MSFVAYIRALAKIRRNFIEMNELRHIFVTALNEVRQLEY